MDPKPLVKFTPKRPPERKPHVTFILGLNCSDGIVLCADSLESDGMTRSYKNKLESVHISDEWGICWGGSGSSAVVDKFSDKLKFALGNGSFNRHEIENKMDTCLELIHQDYPRDPISIVAGLFGRPQVTGPTKDIYLGHQERYLYRGYSQSACVSPVKDYSVAGMDVTLASFILGNTYHVLMSVMEAKRLGIFVTALMKKYAEGVGGPILVIFHTQHDSHWFRMDPEKVAEVEGDYSVEDADAQMSAYWAARNPRTYSDRLHSEEIEKLRKKLRKIRRSASQMLKGKQ